MKACRDRLEHSTFAAVIRIKQLRQISFRRNHRGHSRPNPKERGRNSTRNRGASPAGIEEHISRRVFRKPPVVGHRHPKDSLRDRRTRQRRERTYRSLLLFIGISVANPPIRRDHEGGRDPKRASTSWSEQSDEEEDPNEGGSTERKKERLVRVHVGRSCRVVGQRRRPKNHCSRWNQQKANIGSSSTQMQREGSAGMDHRQRRAQRHECVRGP